MFTLKISLMETNGDTLWCQQWPKNLNFFWIILPSSQVFFLGLSFMKPSLEQVFPKAKLHFQEL
jgi:hypothetical protein